MTGRIAHRSRDSVPPVPAGPGCQLTRRRGWCHPEFVDPRLAAIVNELLEIVRAHPQDLDWQPYYEDQPELLRDLHDHAERIRSGDADRLPELKFSLLPTGPLNEIALSSGWGAAYVRLANEFDGLYAGSATPPRKPDR